MEQLDEVLEVLRDLKKKQGDPLPLRLVFKSALESKICDSQKSVSNCLRKLRKLGKIRSVNSGVDIELLEDIKQEYIQSSLAPFKSG